MSFGTALISIDIHRPVPISAKFVTVMNGLRTLEPALVRRVRHVRPHRRVEPAVYPLVRPSSSIGRYSRMMCFIGSFALFGNR